jgi:hypothetical protein
VALMGGKRGPTVAEFFAANPKLRDINPHANALDAQRAAALDGVQGVAPLAPLAPSKRKSAARGRASQRNGAAAEGTVEYELDGAVEDCFIAWWRHFHPPFLRVAGAWRPRALEPGEGAVDYIVQPFEGPAVLVEAKSIDGPRFPRSGVPDHQQQHLEDHTRAGLPAVLVVTFRTEDLRVAVPWTSVPWRTERSAEALYADEPALAPHAVAPGALAERLLRLAGVRSP